MTVFIIEDSVTSPYVKLFNDAYGYEVLIPAQSSSHLYDKAKEYAESYEHVAVYMDIVPDNPRLYTIYNRVLSLYELKGLDVAVLPIPSVEYLFIRSLMVVDNAIFSTSGLQDILDKNPTYGKSELALAHSKKRSSNFERFCKLFCEYNLSRDCCSVDDKHAGASVHKPYFAGDCNCEGCDSRLTLEAKARNLLNQFSVGPIGSRVNGEPISWNRVLAYSGELVDKFNDWVKSYMLVYPDMEFFMIDKRSDVATRQGCD